MNFSFHVPTRIVFGVGGLSGLSEEVKRLGGSKIYIVTDKTIVQTGILEKVTSNLGSVKYEVFDRVEPEPRIEVAEEVAQGVRGSNYDIVLGVGGGSSLDMAKVAACLATNDGPAKSYVGQNLFAKKGVPSIMIPTTAGTGSEVTVTSMVTVEGHKQWINSPLLLPSTALVDPELTKTMPKSVTAATGLDALAHCVESYLSKVSNPLTEIASLEGVRLIVGNLESAYLDGSNITAREAMSLAAVMGGISLAGRAVYGHSVGYTIATRYKLPHGVSVAVPLPYIVSNSASSCAPKMQRLARAFGVESGGSTSALGVAIAEKITAIIKSVNVPTTLKAVGVSEGELQSLADECVTTYYRQNSPVAFDSHTMGQLYARMWIGDISPLPNFK